MRRQKPFLLHRGVTIWEQYKGTTPLTFWYSLEPGQNEDSDRSFDIRCFPNSYRSGLEIDNRVYSEIKTEDDLKRFRASLEAQKDAHKAALQRAIDDDYNFSAAARGNYSQFGRRFVRYVRAKLT